MHILLVEDDEDDQDLIKYAFEQLNKGHTLQIANNGQEAIDYLSELPATGLPCLIILDLNMPVLDGIQTLEALKGEDKYSGIPKVVFTTSDSPHYKEKSMNNGATDFMVKPSDMNTLVHSVEKMLGFCS
ncbi:MAG: response regulator [Bacteroidota bacterium]